MAKEILVDDTNYEKAVDRLAEASKPYSTLSSGYVIDTCSCDSCFREY